MSETALITAALLAVERIARPGTKKTWSEDHVRYLAICHIVSALRDALNGEGEGLVVLQRDRKTGRFKRWEKPVMGGE